MRNVLLLLCLLASLSTLAQEPPAFNDIDAADELQDISSLLGIEDIDAGSLNSARDRIIQIENAAQECASFHSDIRARLEERYAPLREIIPEQASTDALTQRQSVGTALDEATARQVLCEGIVDEAQTLSVSISELQYDLSQRFLTTRTSSIADLAKSTPGIVAKWSEALRTEAELDFVAGVSGAQFISYLLISIALAILAGLYLRRRFIRWYETAGGAAAQAQMKHLFPKPLAEFSPIWLSGLAILGVLGYCISDPSTDLAIVRFGVAIVIFGFFSVATYWATGPLSPSAEIKGLIPDHVAPVRLRAQLMVLAICASYFVLGNQWLDARGSQFHVAERMLVLLIVGAAITNLLLYLGKIPGLVGRYRMLRFLSVSASILALFAALLGYQNLSGFLLHGITRTLLALFVIWILLWLVYKAFSFILEQKSPAAVQVRRTLGITGKSTGTGVGFMQLVADLVIWMGLVVYLIYVWDNAGSTLGKLKQSVVGGWDFGGVSLVPKNILGGILLFSALIVVIGWIKRWMDRRWLERIAIERGARDAVLTLFGYIAFVLAILLSLKAASVDLTGLAIVSGALALGLGFGLQGIANNFVSGIILLFERPIRAGDFVSVGDIDGFVRSIRIRATEIETLDNQNVLVPNSELVSGRVTNWVLRDSHGRVQVNVGVAYGSDVALVREILESAGRDHPEVISDGRAPAPRALFMGFGDSSLDFELRVRVQRIERRFSVRSDLNFTIDEAFREAGISIPFPQRDLHIVSYPDPKSSAPVAKKKPAVPHAVEDVTRSHSTEFETSMSRDEVWSIMMDTDEVGHWLAKNGSLEPNIGGRVSLTFKDDYAIDGRIDVFIPPRRLRVVVSPDAEEGPLPTGPITIDLSVREHEGRTHGIVTVAGIPGSEDWEEYYRLSVDRWKIALADLQSNLLLP